MSAVCVCDFVGPTLSVCDTGASSEAMDKRTECTAEYPPHPIHSLLLLMVWS